MDKYHEPILSFITRNGESGVNEIAKATGIPLSTTQKYLEKQSYFKKTVRRKWDLPQNVTEEFESTIESNRLALLSSALETQALLINQQVELLQNAFEQMVTQIQTIKPLLENHRPPVANKNNSTIDMDSRLINVIDNWTKLKNLFKKQKDVIPEEYRDLFFNLDYVGFVLKDGVEYVTKFLEDNTYEVLVGKNKVLDEDTISILKENQKEG